MIQVLSDKEYVFYYLMGKYFADRKIIKEMDCQLYNEDGMKWHIYFDKEGNICGFCSIQSNNKKGSYLDNFYVIKEYRGKGIGEQILKSIISQENENISLITRNEIAYKLFKKYGFVEYGKNGRYIKMKREIENDN